MNQLLYMLITFYLLLSSVIIAGDNAEALPMDEKIFKYNLGNYCLDKSYISAIGKKKPAITTERNNDLDYSSCVDVACCCIDEIKALFKEKTKKMTHERVNPAVDKLIEALRNQRMASDDKIKELIHLKYINTLYSFYDEDGKTRTSDTFTMPDEDGCISTITFNKTDQNRKGVYREGILKEILSMLNAWEQSADMITEKNMLKLVN